MAVNVLQILAGFRKKEIRQGLLALLHVQINQCFLCHSACRHYNINLYSMHIQHVVLLN